MGGGSGGSGPLDTMRSLEQFLPGDQPRGFMGPDSGHKGKLYSYPKEFNLISFFFLQKKGVHHLLVIPTLSKVYFFVSFLETH